MVYVDATCPLVSKVHREVERHHRKKHHILMIGHSGHPEVIGTMGQVAKGAMTLIETAEDAETIMPEDPKNLSFVTQTTLSVDDTQDIVAILKRRFPSIVTPKKEDICYATTNRQEAVKKIAAASDFIIVLGAPNSSNSMRLVEVAEKNGARASLVQRGSDINWDWFKDVETLGITAGASAPEVLVEEVINAIRQKYTATIETITTAEENVIFKLPPILANAV